MLLVAVGRRPYTDGLGAREAGSRSTRRAASRSTSTTRPTCAGIYRDRRRASRADARAQGGGRGDRGGRAHGRAARARRLRLHPQRGLHLARAGERRRDRGGRGRAEASPVAIGTFPFLANGAAKAMGERDGQVKIIADAAHRPDPRRPHPRPARERPDRRAGVRDGDWAPAPRTSRARCMRTRRCPRR